MIARFLEKEIFSSLRPGRAVCIFGPRRSGKTVLLQTIKQKLAKKILLVLGQDLTVQEILSSGRVETLRRFLANFDGLFVDEAQYVPRVGENLKLLVDAFPRILVLVTGSSSFDLRNKIGEPLVGRSAFLRLYPFSQLELGREETLAETKDKLESRLIFGGYPQVVTARSEIQKRKVLENLRDGYLLKDILELDNLKDSLFVFNLLRQIAFQIGHDVSYTELASNLNTHPTTVRRYLELLEKTFVLFSLPGFSRNLREEYTKTPRYYFWDNGVRNVLISNFNQIFLRDDVGSLWENYCIGERIKKNDYKNLAANYFYWRTYDQKEIDLVEERAGKLFGYEMKWGKVKVKQPSTFLATYKNSHFQVINKDNYLDFIV